MFERLDAVTQKYEELTKKLREFSPDDPVKYDFALFGVGVNGVDIIAGNRE